MTTATSISGRNLEENHLARQGSARLEHLGRFDTGTRIYPAISRNAAAGTRLSGVLPDTFCSAFRLRAHRQVANFVAVALKQSLKAFETNSKNALRTVLAPRAIVALRE